MAIFKCKMCSGELNVREGMTVCECEFCGTTQTIPTIDDEKKTNSFNRANHLRQNNEFDRSASIYENIIIDFPNEAEAYWGLVLCKFGIEYVDDPITGHKVATCHRTSYESILNDENYKKAIDYADSVARSVYMEEAEYIDKIQKDILRIANEEKPYDVFICYKEKDDLGNRTQDSECAQNLYDQLTSMGLKVFFARITLEDKLGQAYEPYIFAALNSSKVMVVFGTKIEYFNAVWVKNEWMRFLILMKKDKGRYLIPVYKDMDPYDLPDAMSMLQAQDMSKIGFMQDLTRGIKKIIGLKEQLVGQNAGTNQNRSSGPNIDNLLKRGMIALEREDYDAADDFFERVLDENVEDGRAYLGKLMIDLNYHSETDFEIGTKTFLSNKNYKTILKYGSSEFINKVKNYNNQAIYNKAMQYKDNTNGLGSLKKREEYQKAKKEFLKISHYKDAQNQAEECEHLSSECVYLDAVQLLKRAKSKTACGKIMELLMEIKEYKDVPDLIEKCIEVEKRCIDENKYYEIKRKINKAKECDTAKQSVRLYDEALQLMGQFDNGYKDIETLKEFCIQEMKRLEGDVSLEIKKAKERKEERRKEKLYQKGKTQLALFYYDDAIKIFSELGGYKDSRIKKLYARCRKILDGLRSIAILGIIIAIVAVFILFPGFRQIIAFAIGALIGLFLLFCMLC